MKMLGMVIKCWESALKTLQIYTFKQTDYYFICFKHRVLQISINLWSSKRTGAIILGSHFLCKRSADSWHFRWVALAQPWQLCLSLADNVNTYRKCLAYSHTRYSNKCHRYEYPGSAHIAWHRLLSTLDWWVLITWKHSRQSTLHITAPWVYDTFLTLVYLYSTTAKLNIQ